MKSDNKKENKGSSIFSSLLWWKLDQDEFNEQVGKYNTLKIYKSARGLSFILLSVSSLLTVGAILFFNLDKFNLIDSIIFLILGLFIYKGYKWSIVLTMILWTIEKSVSLVELADTSTIGSPFPRYLFLFIWWAFYMRVFYLAFRVERLRSKSKKENRVENSNTMFPKGSFNVSKGLTFFGLLIGILLLLVGSFYWFQVRPAKIKQDCSWIKTHFDKIPATPGKTSQQVGVESKLSKEDQVRALNLARGEIQPRGTDSLSKLTDIYLKSDGEDMIRKMQGFPEQPARDEVEKATPAEYSFCLHSKGL